MNSERTKKEDVNSSKAIANTIQKKNNTGLPDQLKNGVEQLSGHSMDDVKVHYNSNKPAQLQAHAYAKGSSIHIAPGQERHLPHEAWHVVQQKQGRVKPTRKVNGSVNVNDDKGLENEADVMGSKASMQPFSITNEESVQGKFKPQVTISDSEVIQPEWEKKEDENLWLWSPMIDGVTWFTDSSGLMWYHITDESFIEEGSLKTYKKWEGGAYTAEYWDHIEELSTPHEIIETDEWPGKWTEELRSLFKQLTSTSKIMKAFGTDEDAKLRHKTLVHLFITSLHDASEEAIVSQNYLEAIIANYPTNKQGYSKFSTALSATALEPVAAKSLLLQKKIVKLDPGKKFMGKNKKSQISELSPDYNTESGVGDAQRVIASSPDDIVSRIDKAVKDKVGTYPGKVVDVVIILIGAAYEDIKVRLDELHTTVSKYNPGNVFVYLQGQSVQIYNARGSSSGASSSSDSKSGI